MYNVGAIELIEKLGIKETGRTMCRRKGGKEKVKVKAVAPAPALALTIAMKETLEEPKEKTRMKKNPLPLRQQTTPPKCTRSVYIVSETYEFRR